MILQKSHDAVCDKSWLCVLTSEEVHEVSCDVAIGTNDAAIARWSGRSSWAGRALNGSYICQPGAVNQIVLQEALI